MSVKQFQTGPSYAKNTAPGLLALVSIALFGLVLLVYGFRLGFTELRYGLYGKETVGSIRATGGVGPFASLGGYEFVVNGKNYSGLQQKLLHNQPTVQYLSTDPGTNRVKVVAMGAFNWVISLLSIFGGALLTLIGGTQIYVFFRPRSLV